MPEKEPNTKSITSGIEGRIKVAAAKSNRIFFYYYVDSQLVQFGCNHLDVMKLLQNGTYTRIEPERGRLQGYGFTAVMKHAGAEGACHVRGWFDMEPPRIEVTDIYWNDQLGE